MSESRLHIVFSSGHADAIPGAPQDRRFWPVLLTAPDEARPLAEWHEDHGAVTWWTFPVNEPAWIGQPGDSDWPGYHTHWSPHPAIPVTPATKETP